MGEIMYRLLIVGILISTIPLSAQGQQPDAAKLKADARNLVGIIGSDKTKTQTYCQIANVGEQMNRAAQAKDKKKFGELVHKLSELEKKLPEYLGLVESLGKANLTPKDGQEIVSMFDTLEDSCPH
jgi:type I site-specific restriction endonuclease